MVDTFRDVIRLWPSRSSMAADLECEMFVIDAWFRRNSIPAAEFLKVVRAAEKRNLPVTVQLLAHLAEQRKANDKQGGEAA